VLTVDVVPLDDYVRGVVSAEMPASWPAAALEAQAVAARTYAITTGVGSSAYDLYDDTRSQMYAGVSADPYHAWGSQMSLAAATAKLAALVHGTLVGTTVTSHGVSPRILTARIVGTRGSTSVTGAQLQSAFGLATTYAAFTTISTTVSHGALAGSVYPARPRGGSVTVQRLGQPALTVRSGPCPDRYSPSTDRSSCTARSSPCLIRSRTPTATRSMRCWGRST
jgi:hypothetical protein